MDGLGTEVIEEMTNEFCDFSLLIPPMFQCNKAVLLNTAAFTDVVFLQTCSESDACKKGMNSVQSACNTAEQKRDHSQIIILESISLQTCCFINMTTPGTFWKSLFKVYLTLTLG